MRLFIAEKPSVAKAIAAELGQTGRAGATSSAVLT
jgi:DNA topoisomerase IA